MRTLSLKLPEGDYSRLVAMAERTGRSRSEIVRHALAVHLDNGTAAHPLSFAELAKDVQTIGSGPTDLGVNKDKYLEDFGR